MKPLTAEQIERLTKAREEQDETRARIARLAAESKDAATIATKRVYTTPKLVGLGSVNDLTLGGTTLNAGDGVSSRKNKP